MNTDKIDWQSLEFTCTREQNPPFDPEADHWYRTARNYQKKDEEAFATEIVALYRQAIDKNHYNAMLRLGLMYIQGVGVQPDERAAVDLAERVIDLGVASGYYQIGVFLQQGIGVRPDRAASLAYMRKAADMGNKEAQLAIGKKLIGIKEKDIRERVAPVAVAMLDCAFGQGLAEASYELAWYYAKDTQETAHALKAFQAAGKLGHRQSLYNLYSIFNKGEYGVDKDPVRAACYERLWREVKTNKDATFPKLDRICPLPPAPMPKF
ncbi:tetratricopeptide repeat protein [Denitromonas iodatirespirans]|uniref:Sel1 repeat family protein n=1 Tax=Denitromonas iodatirespirans TaxID=2795389 RepID=A0A944HAW2_DENI1|nr:tetratricopeptide repeat protein [Denitromonas iodatirespirans]MBT0963895.1 sel1 repeat family protein [Denitromonas iodatirespirans]